jgi:hypothetical protein
VEKVQTLATRLYQDCGLYGVQVMAQTVLGATPMDATKAIVDACITHDRPILLLGYKTTGRGANFAQRAVPLADLETMLEMVKTTIATPLEPTEWGEISPRNFTLSVDTAFLNTYGPLLDKIGVPAVLRTSPEGKFSMYIDAVTNTAAPSSYGDASDQVPWDPNRLVDIFGQF